MMNRQIFNNYVSVSRKVGVIFSFPKYREKVLVTAVWNHLFGRKDIRHCYEEPKRRPDHPVDLHIPLSPKHFITKPPFLQNSFSPRVIISCSSSWALEITIFENGAITMGANSNRETQVHRTLFLLNWGQELYRGKSKFFFLKR